jgi:prepilin-type N-terminal cleavage/methylation domain-containing protein
MDINGIITLRKEITMKFAGKTRGFTIVEMLTVMGIIAILIGLLVPALNQVKDFAKQVQQKAQFHSIDVALELFKTEFGTYPESSDNVDPYTKVAKYQGATAYCGANKLAEALVGLDYLGFHPNSDFHADGQNFVVDKNNARLLYRVYHLSQSFAPNWETIDENLKARKGPFIDFENANAFRMNEVYDPANLGAFSSSIYTEGNDEYYPPVLCDVYSKKRSGDGNKKTGMPILYYRARTMYTQQQYDNAQVLPAIPGGILDDIYYYPDNENLLSLGMPEDKTISHPLRDAGGSLGAGTDLVDFESMIVNKQVTSIRRPYRAGSYILISAGKDGMYGTGDDLFNFDKGSEQ